jgi:hypothetical protein
MAVSIELGLFRGRDRQRVGNRGPGREPAACIGELVAVLLGPGLLAKRGDLDELRARADAGDKNAAWDLAGLLAKRGSRRPAGRALFRMGVTESGTIWGRLRSERYGIRGLAEAGVPAAEVAGELVVEDAGADLAACCKSND